VFLAAQDQQAPQAVWPVQPAQHQAVDRAAQKAVDQVPVAQVEYSSHTGKY
jgi:hypothetical protein